MNHIQQLMAAFGSSLNPAPLFKSDSSQTKAAVSNSTVTVTLPPYNVGDLLIVFQQQPFASAPAVTAGWTLGGSVNRSTSFTAQWAWRIATGSDPVPKFTWSGGSGTAISSAIAISGVIAASPIGVSASNLAGTSPVTLPQQASTSPNSTFIVWVGETSNHSLGAASGWTREALDLLATAETSIDSAVVAVLGSLSPAFSATFGATTAFWYAFIVEVRAN